MDARPDGDLDIELGGVLLLAAGQALVHLRVLEGAWVEELSSGVDQGSYYPYSRFATLLAAAEERHKDVEPVLTELGIQMMKDWYNFGPGKSLVTSGVGFLHHQTGSEGYRSIVRGPESLVGHFRLAALDEKAGTARVESTTPFPKSMERGVLLGGMRAPGDLVFVSVDHRADTSSFDVRFR
jgi:hypothetical protein